VQGSLWLSRNTAEPEVPHSSLAQRGNGYGGRHDLDKVLITAVIEVPRETVAPRQTRSTRLWVASCRSDLAMADSTEIAVDRKTRWLGRILIGGQPARGHVYFPPSREVNVRLLLR
jgi:hypothetical protein